VKVLLVAFGGALGALARYGVGRAVGPRPFPWATLAINVTGSFTLALLLTLALERDWPEATTLALGTGLLGAYTTFSTFSYETLTLLRAERVGAAGAYVGASLAAGLLAAAAGYAVARRLG
jgi:CrcB protein